MSALPTEMNGVIGVLVMAYGGPNSLEEIPGYLADIRRGRVTTPAVLDEITRNYASIGGKSPLLELTRRQVGAIAAHFPPDQYRFYMGMRHWAPWIEDAVRDMLDNGITRAVSVVMAPHYSRLSIAKYQAKIQAGLEMYRGHIDFAHVMSYHDAPELIRAFARRVGMGLARWAQAEHGRVHVVFSAHSLPERIVKMGDPYVEQLQETARLVAERAGLPEERWSWSFQSAGRSPEPWLGPQLDEHLVELAAQGIQDVISIPVGFVCDHVEILYDIDIQAQRTAKALGMRLERHPALNTDPDFIAAAANAIRSEVETLGMPQPA